MLVDIEKHGIATPNYYKPVYWSLSVADEPPTHITQSNITYMDITQQQKYQLTIKAEHQWWVGVLNSKET